MRAMRCSSSLFIIQCDFWTPSHIHFEDTNGSSFSHTRRQISYIRPRLLYQYGKVLIKSGNKFGKKYLYSRRGQNNVLSLNASKNKIFLMCFSKVTCMGCQEQDFKSSRKEQGTFLDYNLCQTPAPQSRLANVKYKTRMTKSRLTTKFDLGARRQEWKII